jgi:hypothetical protein
MRSSAAELIYDRANAKKKRMGLSAWEDAPRERLSSPMPFAKNYLTQEELEALGRIVNAYLDLAEDMAKRNIPMTMQDWAARLDMFLLVAKPRCIAGCRENIRQNCPRTCRNGI